jgi:small subunit ribosomal protein S17
MAEEEKNEQSGPSDPTAPASPGDETVDEVVAEAADEEVVAEATAGEPPTEEGDTAAEEETAAEAVAEAPAAEETPVEEPASELEPVAEAAADEEPPTEEPEETVVSAEGGQFPAQQETQKKAKRKRLPRGQRPARTRPKREKPAARKPIVRLEKPEGERGRRQERQGTVVSDAMDKTIVVKVDTIKAHPKYKKVVRHAHDEQNQAKAGDVVRIVETRPLSRQKRWRLAEILEVAK